MFFAALFLRYAVAQRFWPALVVLGLGVLLGAAGPSKHDFYLDKTRIINKDYEQCKESNLSP